jgi:LPS export ABC transporter protein LptC
MAFAARPGMIERLAPALRRWQTWLWIALGAVLAYLVYLLVSGLLTPAEPVTPSSSEMVMHDIVSQGQHGRNGWKFEAGSSEISPDGYTTTYHRVSKATFFRDGRPAYRLTADTVTVDTRNQNYSANGGVHVWSTMPTLPEDLQTDNAYWDQSTQMLNCPSLTRFVYHGTVMHTTRMTVNLQTGASELGDTSIDYTKPPPSPTAFVSAAPLSPSPTVAPAPQPSP